MGAIRILLERIWGEIVGGDWMDVLRPIRWPKSKLVKEDEFRRVLNLAALKLDAAGPRTRKAAFVLLDADDDRPCELGPRLQSWARVHRSDLDVFCVVANIEYETWFVSSAPSLDTFLGLEEGDLDLVDPERRRAGKAWIESRFKGTPYSETVDQPTLTRAMDLRSCRERSPSFDKLCRELERRVVPS